MSTALWEYAHRFGADCQLPDADTSEAHIRGMDADQLQVCSG